MIAIRVAIVAAPLIARAAKGGKAAKRAVTVPSGLRDASSGLRQLFADGSIRDLTITSIRATLYDHGFSLQALTRNRQGFRFNGPGGEQVRIMRRGGGWDVRVQNRHGNYLDEFGNAASPALSRGITVRPG